MTFDWQKPFDIAVQLGLFILGWSLVFFIVGVTVAVFFGFIGAIRLSIANSKKKTEEAKITLTSVK